MCFLPAGSHPPLCLHIFPIVCFYLFQTKMTDMNIILEFSAGAELLFGNKKRHEISLLSNQKWTIRNLLKWMHAHILTEREELFLQGDTVRPGILVLVNDTDWELLGELDYELKEKDNVLFISTLHGG